MKRWLLCDLHIHSTFSDGTVPPEEVVQMCGEKTFDVIAITDHVFETQSPGPLELHKVGKSIQDLNAYFHILKNLAEWAKTQFDLLVLMTQSQRR